MERQLRFKYYLVLISLFGSLLVYLATFRWGAGLGEDAAKYLSSAQNLVQGNGLIAYNGDLLTRWPPLYPVLLALLNRISGIDLMVLGWIFNVALFGLSVYLSGLLFQHAYPKWPVFSYLAPWFVITSSALIATAANISSDPLFLVFVLLFLLFSSKYLQERKPAHLIAMLMFAWLGSLTRYAGISLAITGGIILVIGNWTKPRQWVWQAPAFGLAALAPLLGWLFFRDFSETGLFAGHDPFSAPLENLLLIPKKVLGWFVPETITNIVPPLLILLGLVALWFVLTKRPQKKAFVDALSLPSNLPSAAFLIGYSLILIFASSYYELKQPNFERIHVILLPALLVIAFQAVGSLLSAAKPRKSNEVNRWLASGLILLLVFPSYRTQKYIRVTAVSGDASYNMANTKALRESALGDYLENLILQSGELVYSNNETVAWFYMRRQVERMPRIGADVEWPPAGQAGYLVWFKGTLDYKPDVLPPNAGIEAGWLELVLSDDLGDVYRLTRP